MGKCVECGGNISYVTKDILKCEYCGKLYSEVNGNLIKANQASIYETAVMKSKSTNQETLEEAIELFSILGNYKNAGNLEYQCRIQIHQNKVAQEEKKLEERRRAELAENAYKKQKEKDEQVRKIKLVATTVMIGLVVIVGTIIGITNHSKKTRYENAVTLYDQQQYEEALEAFDKMGNYKDAKSQVENIRSQIQERDRAYKQGLAYYNSGAYAEAIQQLQEISDYADVSSYIEQAASALYQQAQNAMDNGDYKLAQEKITSMPEGYDISTQAKALQVEIDKTVAELEKEENYTQAVSYYDDGQYDLAQQMFIELSDYSDSQSYLSNIGIYYYEQAIVLFEQKEYIQCGDILSKIDSSEKWSEYTKAKELFDKAANAYQKNIVVEAKNICRSEGYSSMAAYIEGFQSCLLSGDKIEELKKECTIESISLADISPYYIAYKEHIVDAKGEKDTLGNVYSYCLESGVFECDYDTSWTYAIDGKYQYLNATVAVEELAGSKYHGVIRIYGDGKLLFSDEQIERDTKPYNIQINILGVTDLKIDISGGSGVEAYYGYTMLADPILSE